MQQRAFLQGVPAATGSALLARSFVIAQAASLALRQLIQAYPQRT
jgi:hypothetical protein